MNKKILDKPIFLKRVASYLIDFIVVSLLTTAISLVFIGNKENGQYTERLLELTKQLNNKEITSEEYNKEASDLNYYISKETVGTSIVLCSTGLVYYVILCYFCNGITLGKYLMKLRIVSANDKKLNIGHFLIRALLVNLLLSNLISIIFVLTMNKDTFINIYPKVSNVLTIFLLATMLFVTYRNDGRGLHDIIANTKVISTKEPNVKEEIKEEIKEAKVIEEKMENKETKKKTPKKSTKKTTGGKK